MSADNNNNNNIYTVYGERYHKYNSFVLKNNIKRIDSKDNIIIDDGIPKKK